MSGTSIQKNRSKRSDLLATRETAYVFYLALKIGYRGLDDAAVAAEESRVLDDKSGTVLIISFGRFLVFNCS